jgi:lysophospholipase L1-like esterase
MIRGRRRQGDRGIIAGIRRTMLAGIAPPTRGGSMSRRIHRSVAAALLAAFALGFAAQAPAQTPVRIMPLGDSITAGPGCWRAYLWNRLQTAGYNNIDFVGTGSDGGSCNPGFSYDFDHEGHSGFSITGIAAGNNLPPWLTAARPDVIVMHLGTNDMWGGHIPLGNKITALTQLIGQMRAFNPNIKLVAAKIIPMDAAGCTTCMADVVAFNDALATLAAQLGTAQSPILVADLWTGFDVVNDTFDRVHPVTSGFIKMANAFFPVVAQALNGTSPGFALSVARAGAGTGTVTSTPAGINCGSACTATFSGGTVVTLNAAAGPSSAFAGWSGACAGTAPTCTVTMSQARSVTATFNQVVVIPAQLSVTKQGTGLGTVTSNPAGINCGPTCVLFFPPATGTTFQFTATPMPGSTFTGWGGACSGTGACVVTRTGIATNVIATFTATTGFPLTVTRAGSGTGTVTSNPSGISCGGTCSATFASGVSVTLVAQPASNSTFAGWSGACTGTGSCTVPMTQARNVTATFTSSVATFPLNVTVTLFAGGGSVTSSPAGINCGTTCSASYASGTSVTLTATPIPGSIFVGWSGACTGTGGCAVVMSQARSVTATFQSAPPPVTLTVTLAGTGSGTVTSTPAGINCPTACMVGFPGGNVTLTATPAAGATFAGWSGACTGTGTCTVSMSQPRAVTATFMGGGTGGSCPNPITFSGNTGNFNTTGPVCYRTNAQINGWGCFNFEGRSVTVSGVPRTCGQMPVTRAADGFHYFAVTAGQFPWAGIFIW